MHGVHMHDICFAAPTQRLLVQRTRAQARVCRLQPTTHNGWRAVAASPTSGDLI